MQKERLDNKQRCLSYNGLCKLLPIWKKEHSFLADAPSQTLQQTLKSLSRALSESFDPANTKESPVFKRKYKNRECFHYPQGFKISNTRIFLPKIGWVGFRKSRHIKGKPKNVTVFKEIDHWYISIETESKIDDQGHPSTMAVGADLGIKKMIALSDGAYIPSINVFRSEQQKFRRSKKNGDTTNHF